MNLEYDLAFWQAYALAMRHQRDIEIRQRIKANSRLNELKRRMSRSESTYLKGCARKERYKSKAEAQCESQIADQSKSGYTIYRCKFCSYWHLASKRP